MRAMSGVRVGLAASVMAAGIVAAAGVAAQAQAQTPGQGTAVLTIHPDQAASKVSPTLYGLMTEEINHSYEGGLYAEMVQNETMRADWTGVPEWILLEKGNAEAAMSPDKTTGPSAALPYSLKLDVTTASEASPAGVLNDGFWGMALQPDTEYRGSFYAKEDASEMGPVTVRLVANQTGKVLASAVVGDVGTEWKRSTFTLKTGAVQEAGGSAIENHLELTVGHAGTLWLQLVTLFPPTYHNRANGTRVDLMEKLAAMHPAFLRFPGGNYLEGNHLTDWYDWKKTIGPLVDRPGHESPWDYWSTDGLDCWSFWSGAKTCT